MTAKQRYVGLVIGVLIAVGGLWMSRALTSSVENDISGSASGVLGEVDNDERSAVANEEDVDSDQGSVSDDVDVVDEWDDEVADLHPLLQQILSPDMLIYDPATLASVGLADLLEAAEDVDEPFKTRNVSEAMRQLDALRRAAGRVRAEELGLPLRQELPNGHVREVVGIDEHGQPLYYATRNVSAGISTGAHVLQAQPFGLTGSNLVLGVWDGGAARTTHDEFAGGRLSNMNNVASIHHATHVAGTMIAAGVNASAKGMAPAAQVDSYDWFDDLIEMLGRGASEPNEAGKLYISNHSYGFIRGWYWNGSYFEWFGSGSGPNAFEGNFGRYNMYARDIDALVASRPYYSIFWSAGNDRADNPSTGGNVALSPGDAPVPYDPAQHPPGDGVYRGGYDLIGDHALGKNVITIGAVTAAVSGGERSVSSSTMSSFSAWGPTDDGRIKPDLVAHGTFLYSSGNNGDSHYYTSSGTSMSSPNAAGTAALVKEQFKQLFPGQALRASTMRGLLIHTADDMGNPGPDYRYGWGLVNGIAAAELLADHAATEGSVRLAEHTISAGSRPITIEGVWDGESPIRVTLAWTDPAGTATSTTDNRTSRLVNNLDVKVMGPDGAEYLPFVMPFVGTWTEASMSQPATTGTNNTDNVEQVRVNAPTEAGSYTIVIDYQGSLQNDQQQFSLLSSGLAPALTGQEIVLHGNLDFGEVELGTHKERVLTLDNQAPVDAIITDIDLPVGYNGTWSSVIPAGTSRDLLIQFAPDAEGLSSGTVNIHLAQMSNPLTRTITGVGVRHAFVTIEDPADDLDVLNTVTTYDVVGSAGSGVTGQLIWTNSSTGASGAFTASTPWMVGGLVLAEGANTFDIRGIYQSVAGPPAADHAALYGGNWSSGDNHGTGFLPWEIRTVGYNAGQFIAVPESVGNLDIDDTAWALWANSDSEVLAERPFTKPLAVGDQFTFQWENNWVGTGGTVGWSLLNGAGEALVEFYFVGGQSHYRINDNQSARATGLPYTDSGLTFTFERTGANTYSLTANGFEIGGQLAAWDRKDITRVRVWNKSAGPGIAHNLYANNWTIERSAGPEVEVSDSVTITRLGRAETPVLSITDLEDTEFRASWTASEGATAYAIDVHTDPTFTRQTGSTGFIETFESLGAPSSQYQTRVWTNNGLTWTAHNAKTDLSVHGSEPAIALQNASGSYIVVDGVPGGVDELTIDYRRPPGGPQGGAFSIFINGELRGGPYALRNSADTARLTGLNIDGPFSLMITNSGERVAIFDNLAWTNHSVVAGDFVPGYSNFVTSSTEVMVRDVDPASTYYVRVKALSPNGDSDYAVAHVTTLSEPRAEQAIDFDPIETQVATNLVLLSATATSGLEVSFAVEAGPAVITDGNVLSFTAAGSVSIRASQSGDATHYRAAPDVVQTFDVNKATPVLIEAPTASSIYSGRTLAVATLDGGSANIAGTFEWMDNTITPPDGISAQTVRFVPNDAHWFDELLFDIDVTVLLVALDLSPATDQAFSLEPGGQTNLLLTLNNYGEVDVSFDWSTTPVDGDASWLTLEPVSGHIPVEDTASSLLSIDASGLVAGSTHTADLLLSSEANISPSDHLRITLHVAKLSADVVLQDTEHLYDGSPKAVTVITDPPQLATTVTYDGSVTAPAAVGTYAVEVEINDPLYQGTVTGTLTIAPLTGAILVTDSIAPADDHQLPFGSLRVGDQRIEQVTIHNTNTVDALTILNIDLASALSSPATAQPVAKTLVPTERFPRAPRLAALHSDAPRDEGTLLVRFRPGAQAPADRAVAHTALGTHHRHSYRHIPVDVVELPPGADQIAMIEAYEARADVEYAEPNYQFTVSGQPDDMYFHMQWGLNNTGQLSGTVGADIGALQAWNFTTGSSNVIVAVIDTGVDYTHPELAANMWVNPNPTFGDIHGARWISGNGVPTNGDPMDDRGHGSHIAGVIGAKGNNEIGVAGLNWQVQIMALKFIPEVGGGWLADAIAAVEYAIDHGAHILNNSYAGGYSQTFQEVIEATAAANQLFVAAAGNLGRDNDLTPCYPASYDVPNILTVANSDQNDQRWHDSNWGQHTVHIAAPGRSIFSTWIDGLYAYRTGTSMAAPHVAGAAALLMAMHPTASYAQVKDWIMESATPLPQWESLVVSGGRLNAAAALEMSLNRFSLVDGVSGPFQIPPGESVTLDLRFAALEAAEYTDQLVIEHNDLSAGPVLIELSGEGRDMQAPAVEVLSAQQRTDGSGWVDVFMTVYAPDSQQVDLEAVFTDGVEEWAAWVVEASAASGEAIVGHDSSIRIQTASMQGEGTALTNEIHWVWSSTNAPGLMAHSSARLRVRGVDEAMAGEWAESAPFVIDNVPPNISQALIHVQTSQQGDYVLGHNVIAEWWGFTDEQSDVTGYYVSMNTGDYCQNRWFGTTNALVSGCILDASNTIYIRAVDAFGNVSEPVTQPILVLDPDGIQPGSRMTNAEKDIAGLDASNPGAEFSAEVDQDVLSTTGQPVLRWLYADGREYTIHRSEDPLSAEMVWTSQVVTDYVVEDGWAVWADPEPVNDRRYYRVEVRLN